MSERDANAKVPENVLFHHAAFDDNTDSGRELFQVPAAALLRARMPSPERRTPSGRWG